MGAKVIEWIEWVGLGCIDDDHEDREEKEEEDRLACSTTQGHACTHTHTHWVLSAECGARAVCRYCDGLWAASHSCTFGCAAKACCNATTCECESCVSVCTMRVFVCHTSCQQPPQSQSAHLISNLEENVQRSSVGYRREFPT